MNSQFWYGFEYIKIPSVEEFKKQSENESVLFPKTETITKEFVDLSYKYKYVFGRFLIEQTGLDIFDNRISERNIKECPEESKDFYQNYDSMGLKYFYIRGCARIDRLSSEEYDALRKVFEKVNEASWFEAITLVYRTFKTVMTVNPDSPDTVYEPLMTLDCDFLINGNEIPLAIRSVADFDSYGMIASKDAEDERFRLFSTIKSQIDDALFKDLSCKTRTAVVLF